MSRFETLASVVATFEARGDRPAVLWMEAGELRSMSYAALSDQSLRLAQGLSGAGLGGGSTVALVAANRAEWIIAYLAGMLCGAAVVPLDTLLPAETLSDLVARSGCRMIFTDKAQLPKLRDVAATADLQLVLIDEATDAAEGVPHWTTLRAATRAGMETCRPQDTAVLLYTSGTTGRPKGVPLSHRNLCSNLEALAAEGLVTGDDRVLLPLPLYHAYPCTVGCLGALAYGAAIVLPAGLSGSELTAALRVGRVSVLLAVPRLLSGLRAGIEARIVATGGATAWVFRILLALSRWLRRHLGLRAGRLLFRRLHAELAPQLRLLACGGAELDPELALTLEALGWQVLSGYGLTETAPILTFKRRGGNDFVSVGQALPGVELRVADSEGRGFGEIEARGPNVFAGYQDLPEETARAFTADGWFRTGDLGRLDAHGRLTLVGRAKEMIVLPDGKNIFPASLEEAFAASSLMREAAVLQRGDGLVLLVVPDETALRQHGAARLAGLLRDEIETVSLTLPSYQRVSGFAVTREALPRTTLGKLKRHQLVAIYDRAESGGGQAAQAETPQPDAPELADPTARALWHWLRARFPDKALTLDASPQLDLGIDSLAWVELTMEIEQRFGARLTEAEVSRVLSVRELLVLAAAAAGRGATAAAVSDSGLPPPPGPLRRLTATLLYLFNRAILRLVFRLRVEGLDHLPVSGPFVLLPNHTSYLDPLAVGAALSLRSLRGIYWAGWTGILFAGPLSRWFSRTVNVLPVDPDRSPGRAIELAAQVLERGDGLVWFPEGRRARDGRLQDFQPGIGVLLQRCPVRAVPVRIDGAFAAWPATRRWPRPAPITVVFGPVIEPGTSVLAGESATDAAAIAARQHDAVAALRPGAQS